MELKKCKKCEEEKPGTPDYFQRSRGKLSSECKSCRKLYYEANKKRLLEQKKAYHLANKEEILKKKKEYYETNKEKLIVKQNNYYESNKKKHIETNRIIRIRRKKTDPMYKVTCALRGRVKDLLRGKKKCSHFRIIRLFA